MVELRDKALGLDLVALLERHNSNVFPDEPLLVRDWSSSAWLLPRIIEMWKVLSIFSAPCGESPFLPGRCQRQAPCSRTESPSLGRSTRGGQRRPARDVSERCRDELGIGPLVRCPNDRSPFILRRTSVSSTESVRCKSASKLRVTGRGAGASSAPLGAVAPSDTCGSRPRGEACGWSTSS